MYTTYDIFDDLLGMRRMFDNFFKDIPSTTRVREYPYINLYENGDDLDISIIAPGIKVEDVDLHLINNSLIIEGNKKDDYQDKPYIRKERRFGKFKKSVKLPFRVDINNIHATMNNGILWVKLQKSDEDKPKKIDIK
ncbi:MAG: Hsp20/alpha crystallin family protein [Spirochaetota bacterium]|nr:Hsp20/alpha crystallin family protein [Spirochaetota bacterium]